MFLLRPLLLFRSLLNHSFILRWSRLYVNNSSCLPLPCSPVSLSAPLCPSLALLLCFSSFLPLSPGNQTSCGGCRVSTFPEKETIWASQSTQKLYGTIPPLSLSAHSASNTSLSVCLPRYSLDICISLRSFSPFFSVRIKIIAGQTETHPHIGKNHIRPQLLTKWERNRMKWTVIGIFSAALLDTKHSSVCVYVCGCSWSAKNKCNWVDVAGGGGGGVYMSVGLQCATTTAVAPWETSRDSPFDLSCCHSLFLRLAPFIRGHHSGVIRTTDLASLYTGCPSTPPSPESALTRATPVVGHTHSFTHSLWPIPFVQITYTACLWIVGKTHADTGRTCKLHTERYPGSAGTQTRDRLAVRQQCYPLSHHPSCCQSSRKILHLYCCC